MHYSLFTFYNSSDYDQFLATNPKQYLQHLPNGGLQILVKVGFIEGTLNWRSVAYGKVREISRT